MRPDGADEWPGRVSPGSFVAAMENYAGRWKSPLDAWIAFSPKLQTMPEELKIRIL